MHGKGLIIAIVSVGVSLGLLIITLSGLILNGQSHINNDIRVMQADVSALRNEVHADIAELRERMARLEGLFEGHVKGETR